jgi:hypothetical protein
MSKIMQKLLAQAFAEYDFALAALMALRVVEGGQADMAATGMPMQAFSTRMGTYLISSKPDVSAADPTTCSAQCAVFQVMASVTALLLFSWLLAPGPCSL